MSCEVCGESKDGEVLYSWTFFGRCQSKANSRMATRSGRFIKSSAAHLFQAQFLEQALAVRDPITHPINFLVTLVATIHYPSRRNDLDESLVMDCLQKAGIIQNDRLIRRKIIHWNLDPKNPRVQLELRRLTLDQASVLE